MGKVSTITIVRRNWWDTFPYRWCLYFRGDDGITRDHDGYSMTYLGARFAVWNKIRKLSKKTKEPKVVYRWKE